MGYYLPHRSYLRPRQRPRRKQRMIAATVASITLIAAAITILSIEFGNNKTALADAPDKQIKTENVETPVVKVEAENIPSDKIPVSLSEFIAEAKNGMIHLKWSTIHEANNEFFTIEKSIDGRPFTEVARIESNRESLANSYSISDDSPSAGLIFYRLSQTCFNGVKTYIGLDNVLISQNDQGLSLYIDNIGPEQYSNYLNIGYYSERTGGVSVEIIDKSGRTIFKSYANANKGYNMCKFIHTEILEENEYSVRIANSSGVYLKKIRKKTNDPYSG